MNKLHLLHEAEKLYSVENLAPEMIAKKLNVSRRTIFNWKKKYKWDNHIVRIKDFSKQFAGDIYKVGTKLLTKLNDDIDNNRILNKHEICALENIIKIINREEKGIPISTGIPFSCFMFIFCLIKSTAQLVRYVSPQSIKQP